MQVNTFSRKNKKQRKKIGRGGKKGTYCGRGVKGQKARSGAKINPLFEGGRSALVDRMKKVRGFKSQSLPIQAVKISQLEKIFENGEEVSERNLRQKGFIKKSKRVRGIKIIKDSENLSKKLVFAKSIKFSKDAKKIIEKSGSDVSSDKKTSKNSEKKQNKSS